MTTKNTDINEDANRYLLDLGQRNPNELNFIFDSANKFDEPEMQISKLQASALQFFIKSANIKSIVEVGTFVGFSTFSMAIAMEKTDTKVVSLEINPEFATQAKLNKLAFEKSNMDGSMVNMGAICNIEFETIDAKDYFSNIPKKVASSIDMIFLDGDKANYSFYLNWCKSNLKSGGYLLIDNALFKGDAVIKTGKYGREISNMTKSLKDSQLFDYFFLPVGDCMIVAKKK